MPNRSKLIRGGLFAGLVVALVAVIVSAFVVADSLSAPHAIATSGRTRGNADAKVTLVEYSDFQ